MRLLGLCLMLLSFSVAAQESKLFSVPRSFTAKPRHIPLSPDPQLKRLEAPGPDGDDVRAHLMRLKEEQRRRYPIRTGTETGKTSAATQPVIKEGFSMKRYVGTSGTLTDVTGGTPNDNTLAVSDNGIVMAGINSLVWAYDSHTDSLLFPFGTLSLSGIAGGGGITIHYYDPKLIYDPLADRFILVFLRNNDPTNSAIVVAFSSTSNPLDDWNVYLLPGNPLNNNRWTDYPALSISDKELYITGNLIIPGQPWQLGFDGSVIWQVNLEQGYNNASSLDARLWHDIKFNNRYIRNLHPVQDASGNGGQTQYFLSNRNFSLSNDSVFLATLSGLQDDPNTTLSVGLVQMDEPYGVPPFARQADTDTSASGEGFDTNDGRVLGAFLLNNNIHFTSNSVNPATGLAAIYQGKLEEVDNSPVGTGRIIGHPTWDLGYPNMSFTGADPCGQDHLIAFNYTSPTDFSGVAAVHCNDFYELSDFTVLKEGLNYVDKIPGGYERWGDYFGMQRRYGQPNEVWTSGFYGLATKSSGTWINRLGTPDSSRMELLLTGLEANSLCRGELTLQLSGGIPPYSWIVTRNGEVLDLGVDANAQVGDFCVGDSLLIQTSDSRGCTKDSLVVVDFLPDPPVGTAYPNPFSDRLISRFRVPSGGGTVKALLVDATGRETILLSRTTGEGLHEFSLNTEALAAGVYQLLLILDETGDELLNTKVVKS